MNAQAQGTAATRGAADQAGRTEASPTFHAVATDLVAANRILADLGVLDGFGHVSVRHPDHPGHYLLARRCAPELVGLDDIMAFDLWSQAVDGDLRTPYLERFVHGRIYAARPDVGAVVHSHAPAVVPFAASTVPLAPVYHMASFLGRGAPVFEMRDRFPGTDLLVRDNEHAACVAEAIGPASVVLMRGHGFCAVGRDLPEAVFRAHYTQQNAEVQQRAIALGGAVNYLDARECELATETNRQVMERAWQSWKARVGGHGGAVPPATQRLTASGP
jgi:ribulose-5-phosphate 4-epimerase/fuculose-1-phosphate aldolase